jgi:hypothetical protein
VHAAPLPAPDDDDDPVALVSSKFGSRILPSESQHS